MKKVTILFIAILIMMFSACNTGKTNDNDSETVADTENDTDTADTEIDGINDDQDETGEELPDVTDEDTSEPEQLQTGGIVIYDQDSSVHTILGQGGFFGYSVFRFNEKYWGVSALHESIPPYDFEKAVGRLYIFKRGSVPDSIDDAQFVLTHPDLTLNAGFAFTAAGTCDINKDGFDDIVVSAHLAAYKDAYAAGEIVVFYGAETDTEKPTPWSVDNSSISRVSDALIQKADSMSQSLVCGDIDGDGFDDVMAGGQNAGVQLPDGGSTGMVAFFRGSADGLEENEYWVLTPQVEKSAQYFGSSMILEDVNGDSEKDLIVAGWGLKESEETDNTGGVYIYNGGTDWQKGPSETLFGTGSSQFGSVIKLVKVQGETLLGVIAPDEGKNGTIHFYDLSAMTEKFTVTVPASLDMGDTGGFSDFDTISKNDNTETTLVTGGKYFKDGGRILCAVITPESVEKLAECPWQPETTTGGFGFSVKNVGNIDADGWVEDLIVGMPEYIHTVTQ